MSRSTRLALTAGLTGLALLAGCAGAKSSASREPDTRLTFDTSTNKPRSLVVSGDRLGNYIFSAPAVPVASADSDAE